ncbi:hypothetical protein BCR41DRAFT_63116 [Lobosporangium transversale]|uniref:CAP-Gly domain-containing protein n=1 Tax=Lobosporangium transversale TaxID=64571 RepID=A0A1Y2GNK5_9FUNG|nr:hypothetical protein BCR41DRAFT_63116 [Lobosporangium transversale]ORZ15434.1 hypothetical protein BCR41DRAFT_63116 [Lobosporangium transversale]|eukprot:XP_021881182.1 hypothetical protein BCR41DRAFT_63116 [Lobosporangium transversale]
MAPKTPQANSKLPKPPSAGGHASLTGIPAPGSVLQRRSFMPSPNGASVSKTLKDMSPEQQALLAEAITFHSPGLIDPVRKTTPTTSPAVAPANTTRTSIGSSLSGSGAHPGGADYSTTSHITGFGFTTHHSQRPNSPASSSDRASPTAQPSSTTQRLPSSQISRLGSSTRLSMQSEANNSNIHHGSQSTSNTSRPVSYSGMPPLSISHPNLSTISSTPSPTTPVGITRPGSGSPAGSRSTLQASRLSAGPGITPPAFSQAAAGTRTSMMKSLPHRPPGASTAASTGVTPGNNPVATIPESSAIVPPSLDDYEIGDRVIVESMGLSGYLRFLGPTSFKSGTWAGIELDTPTGKNDGSVEG